MGPRLSVIMGPRHNITHTTGPSNDDLNHVIKHSKPLVIEHTKPTGEVYYPVLLPFNARIVCPYCRKECSIGTYPSHVTGDRRCHEYRRIEEQSKFQIVLQPTQVPPTAVSTNAQVPDAAQITSPLPAALTNPPLNAEKLTADNQAMFAMFLQFTEFIKNNPSSTQNQDNNKTPNIHHKTKANNKQHSSEFHDGLDSDSEYSGSDNESSVTYREANSKSTQKRAQPRRKAPSPPRVGDRVGNLDMAPSPPPQKGGRASET